MSSTLNSSLLAGMLKEKRGNRILRDVSAEMGGVSPATISRIEQGKIPDVETFIKICKWLDAPTDTFIINNTAKEQKSNRDHIVAHLRAEQTLEPARVEMLINMIDLAFGK